MPDNQHSNAVAAAPSSPRVTVFVCTACRCLDEGSDAVERVGAGFADVLRGLFDAAGAQGITVTPMECLAVCKRPRTIAVTGEGCWTYVIGDLDINAHAADVVAAVLAFQRSGNGIVPWKERPQCFRKGVIARIPPLGFIQPIESPS